MDTTQKPHLSHISLCFGYGGIDLGLHRIFGDRLRLAAVCEIEAFALENALSKMEAGLIPPAPIWTDLRTFPWEEFQDVSLVSGGFPCQPFSAAGKRDGDQDPRHLFPYIVDGIKRCRPRFVFLENVEGILSSKLDGEGWRDPAGTPVLLHVLRELERLGYKATAGIFSAAEVGAPHQRKRIFILAYDKSLGIQGCGASWLQEPRPHAGQALPVRGGEGSDYVADDSSERLPLGNRQRAEPEGQCNAEFKCGSHIVWPSRPGEPQHSWEPPRVVGTVPAKLANFCTRDTQSGGDTAQTSSESFGKRGEGADAMPHGGSSLCGGDQGNEQTALADTNDAGWEAGKDHSISRKGRKSHEPSSRCSDQEPSGMAHTHGSRGEEPRHKLANLPTEPSWRNAEAVGNAASERSHRGTQDGFGLQPEMLGEGHEAMGNAENQGCRRLDDEQGEAGGRETRGHADWSSKTVGNSEQFLLPATREHRAMDEESRIPADREGCESSQADSIASATREREGDGGNASEFSKIESSLGRDAYEPPIGMDISELSGLSDQELAEIREWMVKTDNRTDELRLLGNGVVPPTATRAFLNLFEKLK